MGPGVHKEPLINQAAVKEVHLLLTDPNDKGASVRTGANPDGIR